jgi:hypothetical protein
MFASADTAYVLAFSIIMLTTDLHSPQVGAIPLFHLGDASDCDGFESVINANCILHYNQ